MSVAIAVDNAFQAYTGGVFNCCGLPRINHAVVIVGWDDNQGGGIWIIRNCWGRYWGEGGYMRIPYGCDLIGYNATYVNYPGRLAVQADTTLGPAPLPVNFSIGTALDVQTANWTFGDGQTSTLLAPSHTYTNPGVYGWADGDVYRWVTFHQCSELCRGIRGHVDRIESKCRSRAEKFEVDIYARNYLPLDEIVLPLTWSGSSGVTA